MSTLVGTQSGIKATINNGLVLGSCGSCVKGNEETETKSKFTGILGKDIATYKHDT